MKTYKIVILDDKTEILWDDKNTLYGKTLTGIEAKEFNKQIDSIVKKVVENKNEVKT